jgi:NAD(P)-dependent dehydrogenase (short-subunit alcohol dehydrogenase family)
MQRDLAQKNALVTGSSRGIGRETALTLARDGANVVVHASGNANRAKEVVDEVRRHGVESFCVLGDVSNEDDVQRIFAETRSRFGSLDILINNAGMYEEVASVEMTQAQWRRMIDVNLTGVFFCSQAAAKIMIETGSEGNIVNVSSISGHVALSPQRQAHYNASKGGVGMLTKSLAVEWAKHKIRVNAISPGYVRTELTAELSHLIPSWEERIALGKIGTTGEIAEVISFLAGPRSSFVTGADWIVDGGHVCW